MNEPSSRNVGIIGAGMAGLACATALRTAGRAVLVFDKGRRPGGRMSTKSLATPLGDAWFDYGAQYMTARDPDFQFLMEDWVASGLVAPWPAAGPEAYVGVPGMSAPIGAMAEAFQVRWSTRMAAIERETNGWRLVQADGAVSLVDAVVVALPAEQAEALLLPVAPAFAARAADTHTEPCWTVMAAFADRLPVDVDCWRGAETLGWAARNTSKPGRRSDLECWVLQASPAWSRANLEADADQVASHMLQALAADIGAVVPPPVALATHRWRYARSGAAGTPFLWDPALRLGVCGDWLLGPRVEPAWVSGTALGRAIR